MLRICCPWWLGFHPRPENLNATGMAKKKKCVPVTPHALVMRCLWGELCIALFWPAGPTWGVAHRDSVSWGLAWCKGEEVGFKVS